jgi:N-acetylglucosaminyl-diphospho-decaprenol L-rhamnosyltransferase
MSSSAIDVSIVVVSWNTKALVRDCLAALGAASGGARYEAIVADNASTDGTVEAVSLEHPTTVLIANDRNLGFAAANNQGIRVARGRYVLLLNSDTIPEPRSIEKLVAFADATPRAGCVGGMLLHGDGRFQASFQKAPSIARECLSALGLGRRLWFEGYPGYGPEQSQTRREVEVVPGACMLLRRSALDQVGLLDESYFMYSEETDLCRRLRATGWEVWYVPESRIIHLGGQSTRQVRVEMVRALYRSKVRYMALHHGAASAVVLRSLLTLILRGKRLAAVSVGAGHQFPLVRWRDLDPSADTHDARSVSL